jgi:hypothetical protein
VISILWWANSLILYKKGDLPSWMNNLPFFIIEPYYCNTSCLVKFRINIIHFLWRWDAKFERRIQRKNNYKCSLVEKARPSLERNGTSLL